MCLKTPYSFCASVWEMAFNDNTQLTKPVCLPITSISLALWGPWTDSVIRHILKIALFIGKSFLQIHSKDPWSKNHFRSSAWLTTEGPRKGMLHWAQNLSASPEFGLYWFRACPSWPSVYPLFLFHNWSQQNSVQGSLHGNEDQGKNVSTFTLMVTFLVELNKAK